jgi:uncharacterized protein (TIGR02302 family)
MAGDRLNDATLTRLSAPLAATLAGLWAERLSRAFWPFWTVLLTVLSALAFGLVETLPLEAVWFTAVGTVAALAGTAVAGLRAFRRPRRADAIARLDATLPGRPLATLADRQAVGEGDPASAAVWAAHRARMAERALTARPVAPDLRLSARDPFGLRYVALTLAVLAALFGSAWRIADAAGLAPGRAEALAAGPAWEGWIQPPPYTGLPTLYLNEVAAGDLRVPRGSRVQLRLYGEIGALTVAETVSGRPGTAVPPASDPAQEFDVARSGQIEISGPGGRRWVIGALHDAAPTIAPTGPATQGRDGEMRLPFQAGDDYGVTGARATVTLDLAAVDRRYGLTIAPEPREALVIDAALPLRGDRKDFAAELVDDVSKHPFANLPVVLILSAADAAGLDGQAAPLRLRLPGKRFFDPLAAALIEMRRDLLWNRANAPEAARILRAVTHRPDGFIRNEKAWLQLRVLMRRLDAEAAALAPEARDEIAEQLWEIALMVEEGDLASTLERLQRAQDRLDEAIRNGADPAEIERLMQEYREAVREHMRELAEQAERRDEGLDEPNQGSPDQQMQFGEDQLQQLMDELQRLLEEGRTAEAAELMERLRQLMENMRVEIDPNAPGGPGQGNQSMRDLGQTLRDQQGLSDDAFNDLQNGSPGENGQPGQEPREGEGEGEGEGQDGRSLAERQRELRQRLQDLQDGGLPGDGSEMGEAGRRQLDEAGRAMREAEEALREGDLPGALDRQAEAMEALREGMRNFGEAMAEEQRERRDGQAAEGEAFGNADPRAQRDPLGREPGDGARIGSDRNLLQGEDVYRRAEELLGEIRRRQGEAARPEAERDYLRRLLDLF